MERPLSARRAFTLIELLVVVAIIALLLSILLPSLTRAKEQARIAKCGSNLRTIVQAAAAYLLDNNTFVFAFPQGYYVNGEPRGAALFTEFIWGGGIPDKHKSDWDNSQGDGPFTKSGNPADVYKFLAVERPMNAYVTPEVSWDDPRRMWTGEGKNTPRVQIPYELPDVFKCPSDSTAAVPSANRAVEPPGEPDSIFRTWEFWSNSYPINWYWAYYWSAEDGFLTALSGDRRNGKNLPGRGPELIRQKQNYGAAEFILFYENQLNFALEGARARGYVVDQRKLVGWHKQDDYHYAGFMDGHAEYRYFDTLAVDGPGWTTWPNRPWTGMWAPYNDN